MNKNVYLRKQITCARPNIYILAFSHAYKAHDHNLTNSLPLQHLKLIWNLNGWHPRAFEVAPKPTRFDQNNYLEIPQQGIQVVDQLNQ